MLEVRTGGARRARSALRAARRRTAVPGAALRKRLRFTEHLCCWVGSRLGPAARLPELQQHGRRDRLGGVRLGHIAATGRATDRVPVEPEWPLAGGSRARVEPAAR